ncbi:hypothetical protein H5410_022370 [Solanum commersonii]|uniref:NB-ARC domain-containing protein n=1 Tax=Solanum commersonii TaxID=4109 RepID=A0A9J5ZDZ4_SOLCO|nr:hypothetical protein H5410_022370 [Solanum commersonii]
MAHASLCRSYSGEPKVIPIVGMGGIGKTAVAKEVYNDVSIHSHYDVRAWATVSQQHNGKRYFPSQDNGSRILVTTRNIEVACYADIENLSLHMDFMDQAKSWNLFKTAAFVNEALPYEFETIGKQIAEKYHGLPQLLSWLKGFSNLKGQYKIGKSFVTNDPDEQCSHVLGLSYNYLTSDIKTYLFYFRIFPEDTDIPVKNLMRLWMAEGFLNLENDLEEEVENCLQHLINRCLVFISKKSVDEKKFRSCKVHDLINDLCLREILHRE